MNHWLKFWSVGQSSPSRSRTVASQEWNVGPSPTPGKSKRHRHDSTQSLGTSETLNPSPRDDLPRPRTKQDDDGPKTSPTNTPLRTRGVQVYKHKMYNPKTFFKTKYSAEVSNRQTSGQTSN